MSKNIIPFSVELVDEEEERNRIDDAAERIVERLIRARRVLFRLGYGSPQLIFSEGTFVSLTYGCALREVAALVKAGAEPLGFIAPRTPRRGRPFVKSWDYHNEKASADLCRLATSLYRHRLITMETEE
jgi:hypothetical protein